MKPQQLGDYRVPSDAHLHPDGERAAFVVAQMDLEADEYVSQIWLFDGTDTRKLTTGRSDRSPRWSPGGGTLAFLRKGSKDTDHSQLALLPVAGGEARIVTEFELGVSSLAWSPDGSRILLQVTEYIDGIEDEEERTRAPRRILDPAFRFDNLGWTHNKRSHLWVYDVASDELRQLTSGTISQIGGTWSPDGSTVAFRTSTDDDRWLSSLGYVHTVASGGGESVAVTERGDWSWVGYAPDGDLYMIGMPLEHEVLETRPVQRLESDGALTRITDLDRDLMPGHPPGILVGPRFLDDGTVECVLEDRGAQRVISITTDGTVSDVIGGNRCITGWDPKGDGSVAVFTATSATEPGEVFWWDGESERALTDLNDGFAEAASLVEPQEFTYDSDGHEIHGWVLLPPGDGPVPILLNIHGGPATQYGWGFFDEFQVYVEAGYGVVGVNPRGSSGYGEAHMQAPSGHWGDEVPPDQADLLRAPFAAAEQFPRLDTDRLGVMGGSYGGLSTVMVTSMDQRYRSAVAERGVYNWASFAGTADIPWFNRLYLGAETPANADDIWRTSALSRAETITTPTLVIHSEGDFRCPIEQGQQLFMVLYRQGTETEFLLFPSDEGHELSRSGTPKHRVERFDAILDWHAGHLGV
jgi:dipeptidyl aminopeptidase/acylaminoacyl peptidase